MSRAPFLLLVVRGAMSKRHMMGAQEHKTKVLNNTLNPKWNHSMQFTIRDPQQDTLCITVYDRDLFTPNGTHAQTVPTPNVLPTPNGTQQLGEITARRLRDAVFYAPVLGWYAIPYFALIPRVMLSDRQ